MSEKVWDGLKPRNVVQAARADIERRRRNEQRDAGDRNDDMEVYAFSRRHVRRADGVFGLIALALDDVRAMPLFERKKKMVKSIHHATAEQIETWDGEWTQHPLARELERSTKRRFLKNLYNEELLAAALKLERKPNG